MTQPLGFCSLVRSSGPRGWAVLEGNKKQVRLEWEKFFSVKLLLTLKKKKKRE